MLKHATQPRIILAIMLYFFCLQEASAQLRIGLRADPAISYNRPTVLSDSLQNIEGIASALVSFGLVFEIEPTERYHLLLTLSYQPRNLRFKYDRIFPGQQTFENAEEYYKLQYICLGVGINLLTDDILPRTRLAFAVEPALALKIYQISAEEKASEVSKFLVDRSSVVDIFFRFSAVAEIDIGLQTSIFLGPFYEAGLVNMVGKEKNIPLDTDLNIRNRRTGLSVGIKF